MAKTKVASAPKKGLPKILIFLIVFVVLAGAGGYYFFSQTTGISLPGVSAPLNPNCKHNDPDLCKFLNNWREIKDYTITSSGEYEGEKMDSVMKMSGDDKFQMMTKSGDTETYNVITIGDTTYTKDLTDGKWWKVVNKPVESGEPVDEMKKELDFDEAEDATTYKAMGKEDCNGKSCFKYEVVSAGMEGSTEYILFDDREYRLRKTISISDGDTTEASFSYDSVSISVPSPVKDAGENGENMYNQGSGYSEEDMNKMMQQYQGETSMPDYEQPVTDDSGDY